MKHTACVFITIEALSHSSMLDPLKVVYKLFHQGSQMETERQVSHMFYRLGRFLNSSAVGFSK